MSTETWRRASGWATVQDMDGGDGSGGSDLRPDELDTQVVRALDLARRRAGLTVEDMVRRLRPALRLPDVPEEKSEVRNTWYAWKQRPRAVPAVALLAAAQLAGTTVDALLLEYDKTEPEGRLARLEREVAEQQGLIDQLRRAIERSAEPSRGRPDERLSSG
jgi:hypothetical protein